MASVPVFDFDYNQSVADFAISKRAYLAARTNASFDLIATSTLVVDDRSTASPRILLLQRALSDSLPGRWEPPGGACDDDDQSILHGAVRELEEETALRAARVDGSIGTPHFFTLRGGRRVCRFHFRVSPSFGEEALSLQVKLDPSEHQQFVWVTESDVRVGKADGIDLEFTRPEVRDIVLLAFEYNQEKENTSPKASDV